MFSDAGLLHKLKPYGISGQMFALISSSLINKGLQVVLDRKSPQEYSVNAGVTQCSIPGPTPFLLHINDLPDDVVCDITDYADDTTLYSKCVRHLITGNNSNWLLNLNLIYETLDWSRKQLVDFNAGKTQLVSFDQSNNTDTIDVKMDEYVLMKKDLLRCQG